MPLDQAVTGRGAAAGIKRPLEIRAVMSRGRRVAGELVVAYVLASPGQTRVGFASSRAVGGAVTRNRARRMLREAWRALRGRAREGRLIMLVAQPGIAGARTPEVERDIERILAPEGVLG